MTALAERAVACAGFRWMAGMAYVATCTDGGYTQRGRTTEAELSLDGLPTNKAWTAVPDLDDPATLGCFEHALLPERWRAWAVRVEVDHERLAVWSGVVTVWAGADPHVFEAQADTRVRAVSAALVAALEAAPQPGPVTP